MDSQEKKDPVATELESGLAELASRGITVPEDNFPIRSDETVTLVRRTSPSNGGDSVSVRKFGEGTNESSIQRSEVTVTEDQLAPGHRKIHGDDTVLGTATEDSQTGMERIAIGEHGAGPDKKQETGLIPPPTRTQEPWAPTLDASGSYVTVPDKELLNNPTGLLEDHLEFASSKEASRERDISNDIYWEPRIGGPFSRVDDVQEIPNEDEPAEKKPSSPRLDIRGIFSSATEKIGSAVASAKALGDSTITGVKISLENRRNSAEQERIRKSEEARAEAEKQRGIRDALARIEAEKKAELEAEKTNAIDANEVTAKIPTSDLDKKEGELSEKPETKEEVESEKSPEQKLEEARKNYAKAVIAHKNAKFFSIPGKNSASVELTEKEMAEAKDAYDAIRIEISENIEEKITDGCVAEFGRHEVNFTPEQETELEQRKASALTRALIIGEREQLQESLLDARFGRARTIAKLASEKWRSLTPATRAIIVAGFLTPVMAATGQIVGPTGIAMYAGSRFFRAFASSLIGAEVGQRAGKRFIAPVQEKKELNTSDFIETTLTGTNTLDELDKRYEVIFQKQKKERFWALAKTAATTMFVAGGTNMAFSGLTERLLGEFNPSKALNYAEASAPRPKLVHPQDFHRAVAPNAPISETTPSGMPSPDHTPDSISAPKPLPIEHAPAVHETLEGPGILKKGEGIWQPVRRLLSAEAENDPNKFVQDYNALGAKYHWKPISVEDLKTTGEMKTGMLNRFTAGKLLESNHMKVQPDGSVVETRLQDYNSGSRVSFDEQGHVIIKDELAYHETVRPKIVDYSTSEGQKPALMKPSVLTETSAPKSTPSEPTETGTRGIQQPKGGTTPEITHEDSLQSYVESIPVLRDLMEKLTISKDNIPLFGKIPVNSFPQYAVALESMKNGTTFEFSFEGGNSLTISSTNEFVKFLQSIRDIRSLAGENGLDGVTFEEFLKNNRGVFLDAYAKYDN